MREIKFKHWRIKSKKMGYPNSCPQPYLMMDGNMIAPDMETDMTNEIILLQYTGLKDKRGSEIYEGDIVLNKYGKFIVIYEGERRSGYVLSKDGKQPFIANEYSRSRPLRYTPGTFTCEVIGNIYETPELTK